MARSHTIPLLFLSLKIFLLFQSCDGSNVSSTQTQNSLIMPLKVQTASLPRKLNFQHGVALTVSLTVGTPPQKVTMVLDTGSELSWLHCTKLPNLNFIFNPHLSTSYTPNPCTSPICTTKTRDLINPVTCDAHKLCHVIVSYADSSSLEGNLATDTFFIGGTAQPRIAFGCMDTDTSTNPEDSKTTGLMGMDLGALSFINQMGLSKFSYCISGKDSTGVLILGDGANFPRLGRLSYTPLVKITTPLPSFNRFAYTVQLEGIKVSNKLLPLPKSVFLPDHTGAGQTMMDSGTQFTFLLGTVYTALKNEFALQTKNLLKPLGDPSFVFQGTMDLCFRVPSGSRIPVLPTVTLVFNGAEMSVTGERLLYKVNNSVYCFTFGNSDLLGAEAFIIGNHHQQNMWMEYDLANSRIGFTNTNCALATQQLGIHS
ncbi:aspartic proteinase PCS1-like [Cicer arietinum]|uniref:Aspartic proteinase PCS1-like n=1 Tax=Cicer arietinum TaxID=3827 RepID=A0A1S3E096_CICAR|nr:aspartic proteinase PCS1-like [Cicer arietinum]